MAQPATSKILPLLCCHVSLWPGRRSCSQLLRIEKVPHALILPHANLTCTRSSAEVSAKKREGRRGEGGKKRRDAGPPWARFVATFRSSASSRWCCPRPHAAVLHSVATNSAASHTETAMPPPRRHAVPRSCAAASNSNDV
jgi:hypothetical protein